MAEDHRRDSARELRDVKLEYLSLDLFPGPYQSIPARTDTQNRDEELAWIRAEIIRMSGRLPMDDPLRIAIATCPVSGSRIVSQGDLPMPAHCPHGTAMIQPGRDTTGREADGA
jgi:hypothetical protein